MRKAPARVANGHLKAPNVGHSLSISMHRGEEKMRVLSAAAAATATDVYFTKNHFTHGSGYSCCRLWEKCKTTAAPSNHYGATHLLV